jgi:hypothetical protein
MGQSVSERSALGAWVTIRELDAETGVVLSQERVHNIVPLQGKKAWLNRLVQEEALFIRACAFGDNVTTEALGDAALYNELLRIPVTSFTAATDNGTSGLMTVITIMGSTQGNGNTYREAGLTLGVTAGISDLFNRVTFADKVKTIAKILIMQFDFTLT